MSRLQPALALVVPALVLASACSDSPTAPSRARLAPTPTEPQFSIYTPLLLPPGAKWGHYFNSFNTDRHLSVYVIFYPDSSASGRGVFVLPGGAGAGRLNVTKVESTSSDCVPWGTPCANLPEPRIPESSTVSGDGTINGARMTFTLQLQSHQWPPQGWTPGADPGTNYDTATLTICILGGGCLSAVEFYGELHHEPT
jgi:hypothetical protein